MQRKRIEKACDPNHENTCRNAFMSRKIRQTIEKPRKIQFEYFALPEIRVGFNAKGAPSSFFINRHSVHESSSHSRDYVLRSLTQSIHCRMKRAEARSQYAK
jgi:hypothetical protein